MGFPSVIVPVLSKRTAFTLPERSKDAASLNRIPYSAAFPVPTVIAIGVANPIAQGQDMTRTEIKIVRPNAMSFPAINHKAQATIAIVITAGTNTRATLSASLAIGALVLWVSSIALIIFDKTVSSPTAVTSALIEPFVFTVPP